MMPELQAENFGINRKRVRCDWSDNVIIPNVSHFKETDENFTKILNPRAKSIKKKQAEKILEEIYG